MKLKNVTEEALNAAIARFKIEGELISIERLKTGHIHDTYCSSWKSEGKSKRFIHQRLNSYVFPNLLAVIQNISKVTHHIQSRLDHTDSYCTLQLVRSEKDELYYESEDGSWWRTFHFIEKTKGYECCPSVEVAYESGRVCGLFASYVSDMSHEDLEVTIPNFINSPFRYEQLQDAIKDDCAKRSRSVSSEVSFALEHSAVSESLLTPLKNGNVPYRVSHNDTKIDNILFHHETNKGICLVDLDTCMPGSPLFDYGDLVRTTAFTALEDETDLEEVQVIDEFYESVSEGFLEACSDVLTAHEKALLPQMPPLVSLTLGVRFLTDYLNGDKYFKIDRPEHNLDRARTQFKVFKELSKKADSSFS